MSRIRTATAVIGESDHATPIALVGQTPTALVFEAVLAVDAAARWVAALNYLPAAT